MIELLSITGAAVVGSIIISSLSLKLLKSPTKCLLKLTTYKIRKRQYKKLLKKGILERDFNNVSNAVRLFKNLDITYETDNIAKIYKLYNINEEIAFNEQKFNHFYKINVYDRLTEEEIRNIVDNYCVEKSVSIVDTFRMDL